jgi:hypothetical protein
MAAGVTGWMACHLIQCRIRSLYFPLVSLVDGYNLPYACLYVSDDQHSLANSGYASTTMLAARSRLAQLTLDPTVRIHIYNGH